MIEIIQSRKFGEPALRLPKELKGIRSDYSYQYNRKCKCPIYIKEDSIFIKHRDFISKDVYHGEEYIKWKENHNRFVYNDKYGCITLRGEAWFCLRNILKYSDLIQARYELITEMSSEGLYNSDDMRMFSDLLDMYWMKKYHPERCL